MAKTEEELRQEIELQVRQELTEEAKRALGEFQRELKEKNDAQMKEAIAEFKKRMTPMTKDEIQLLVDAEYVEFKVKLPFKEGTKEFTIKEQPQSIERKFYKKAKDRLLPHIQKISELTVNILEGQVENKLAAVLESIEPALDVLADATHVALNPRDSDPDITIEWVKDNLSTHRQYAIVLAQVAANRLRDFFSKDSLSQLEMMTMITNRPSALR